jgi:CheY-like chemotaxis protein
MRMFGSSAGIKGIALSGYGMEEDVRRSLEAGFSCHVTTPVSSTRLCQELNRLLV